LEHRRRLTVGEQLRTRHSPARVLGRLAEVGEPKEHASHERLLSIAAAEEDLLRGVGDRAAYAAGIAVARDGQHATNSARPRLVERMREQRERARLALDVGEHSLDQAGLEAEPGGARGTLDRPVKLVASHRPEQVLVLGHRTRETWMLGAASVEVGAK